MLTYGDGVANVDLAALEKFHREHGKTATMTAVNIGQQFGILEIQDDSGMVESFREKNDNDGGMINAGFMVVNPEIFDYLASDETVLEREPLEQLSKERQLMAFCHEGFWKCMDTKRDREHLEQLISAGNAPWIIW